MSGVTTPGASRLQASQSQQRSTTMQRLHLAPVRVPWCIACCARSPGLWHPAAFAAWHLSVCLGCGRRRASLACLMAPRGAPRLVRSSRSRCSGRLSRRRGAFPHPGGLHPRLYWAAARGTRRLAENRPLCACRWPPPRRGRWARSASYPFGAPRWGCPWRVPPALVFGWVRCDGWRVWTRSLTSPVSRTVCRSTGDSAGAPGLFRVDADTAPCGSEDAGPGSRACVRVLALLGRVWGAASWARSGAPHLFLWPLWLSALLGRSVPCVFFFPCSRPRCLSLSLVSGPGCLGPWRCALRFFFFFLPPLSSRCALAFLLFFWFCLAFGCSLVLGAAPPPPIPLCLAGFVAAARCHPLFFVFFFLRAPPLSLAFSGFRPRVPWALALCFVCFVGLPLLGSPCALSFFCVSPRRWLLPGGCCPPPPCRLMLCSFFFFVVGPRSLRLSPVSGPACLGPRRCALFALSASRFSALRAFSPLSCLPSGRWLLPGGCCPPPPFVSRDFCRFRSVLCAVCCAVLCVPGCGAARCVARCCAVVCCVVLLRSVGAASRRAVPSGAPRRPGALCFAALCFAVFPRAVCVLLLRGGALAVEAPLPRQGPAAGTKSPVLGRPPRAPRSHPVKPGATAPGVWEGTGATGKPTGAPRATGPDEARRTNAGP